MVCGCFSGVGIGLLIPVKGNLNAFHTKTFRTILYFQHRENNLGKALFYSRLIKIWLDEFGVKNLTGLYRVLTSTSSNTFGMNWNGDQEPGLFVQHQCLTSQMFYWLNRQKFPLVKRPSRRMDAGCMGEQLCISMYLEYDVIKVLLLVIVRSPNTFVHIWAKSYFARTLVKNDKYIKVYIFLQFYIELLNDYLWNFRYQYCSLYANCFETMCIV